MWQHIATVVLIVLITAFSLWAFMESYRERKRLN